MSPPPPPPPPPGAAGYAWPPAAGGPVLAGPAPLRPTSSGRGRRVVGFVLSAALILGIRIGARLIFDDDDPRPSTVAGLDDTGLGSQTGDPIDDLAVGDCYQDRSSAPPVSGGPVEAAVEEISCAEPHDAEVFLVTEIARDERAVFPGEERAFDLAAELCLAEYAIFVGVPYESSSLDFMVLYPSAQTWSYAGDRAVVCAVTTLDGSPLTFPVQNSGL